MRSLRTCAALLLALIVVAVSLQAQPAPASLWERFKKASHEVFVAVQRAVGVRDVGPGSGRLMLLDIGAAATRELWNPPGGCWSPVMLGPDGIAVLRADDAATEQGEAGIWLLTATGEDPRLLLGVPGLLANTSRLITCDTDGEARRLLLAIEPPPGQCWQLWAVDCSSGEVTERAAITEGAAELARWFLTARTMDGVTVKASNPPMGLPRWLQTRRVTDPECRYNQRLWPPPGQEDSLDRFDPCWRTTAEVLYIESDSM